MKVESWDRQDTRIRTVMLRRYWLALLGLPLAWARVSLVENGYKGLVVAISPEEEENPDLVESIKDLLTKASAELYGATRQRAYFKLLQ